MSGSINVSTNEVDKNWNKQMNAQCSNKHATHDLLDTYKS